MFSRFTLDYCFKTDVWTELNFHKHLLTKIYRQLNDDYFTSILDRLRTNCLTLEDCHTLIKRIPIIPIDTVPWPNDVVPLHMFGRLEDVDKVNRTEYAKLKGDECVSVPAIVWKRNGKDHVRSGCDAKLAKFEKEFLSNINVLAELKIKQNMQVIVRLNVYSANIYNGMRGRISRIDYDTADTPALLEITLADGTTREITKHMYTSNYDNEHTLCVSQFPVNMAWATTIHKAQGMTLDKIVLDLSMRSIWSAYQAYVGLSRTRKLSDVFLVNFVPATVMGCKEVEEMYANSAADCGGEADDDRENDVDGGKRRATLDDEINNRKRVKRAAAASDSSIYDYDSLYDERAQLVNPQSHGNLITSYLKDIDHSTRHLMLRLRDPNQRTGILMDDKSLLVFDKYDTNVLDGYKERSETITLYPTGAYPLVPPKPEDYCPLVHTLILLLQDVNENTIITFKKRPGVAGGDLFVEITKSSCVFLSGLFLKNYNTLLVDTKCTMKTFIKKWVYNYPMRSKCEVNNKKIQGYNRNLHKFWIHINHKNY